MKIDLQSPWQLYRNKINALFGCDPDIKVSKIVDTPNGYSDYSLEIEVRNHEKFLAISQILPRKVRFGNVHLAVVIYDEENLTSNKEHLAAIYEAAFKGNPNFDAICERREPLGGKTTFVRFQPKVLQFYADDISTYDGYWSGLAQDIAKELFRADSPEIEFCTALNEDN